MMKRLKVIYDDCVPEEKKEVKSDEFTKLKKKIAQEIRDIREVFFFSSASCLPLTMCCRHCSIMHPCEEVTGGESRILLPFFPFFFFFSFNFSSFLSSVDVEAER